MNTIFIIHFTNGSHERLRFAAFVAARRYCQRNISYTGGKVRRVEIEMEGGGTRAMWDIAWDAVSQQAGLS